MSFQRGDGTWEISGSCEILVDISSATHGSKHQYPMNRSHSDMVKYSHEHDELYLRVRSALKPLVGQRSKSAAGITESGYSSASPVLALAIQCIDDS